MAAARRLRACPPSPGTSAHWRRRWAKMRMPQSVRATIHAVGREARRKPATRPCLLGRVASPTMSGPNRACRVASGNCRNRFRRARTLAVGQRLVTRDGAMRRWDGFVTKVAGAAAAERLLRANRLALLADSFPRSRKRSIQRCGTGRGASTNGHMPRAGGRGPSRGAAAERDAREAGREIDAAAVALERLEAQRSGLSSASSTWSPCSKLHAKP